MPPPARSVASTSVRWHSARRPQAAWLRPLPACAARLQKKEDLDADEEYAVERLCSWLSRVGGADPLLDEVLDETQREFLLSYRLPEAEADSTPGSRQRSRNRQYILPERLPRNAASGAGSGAGSGANSAAGSGSLPALQEGNTCGCETPGRSCSEDAEAANDPALQEQLQAVSCRAGDPDFTVLTERLRSQRGGRPAGWHCGPFCLDGALVAHRAGGLWLQLLSACPIPPPRLLPPGCFCSALLLSLSHLLSSCLRAARGLGGV